MDDRPTLTPILRDGHYHLGNLVLPRVSTILQVLARPGLEAWRHKVGLDEAARVNEAATALGRRVHAACEAVNLGRPARVPVELVPFVDSYLAWYATHIERALGVEHFVWHRRHHYGGTADLIAELRDGRRALVDLKTSNTLDGTYRLQTAAYADALAEMGEPVDVRMVVQLPSRQPGTLRAVEYDDDERDTLAWRAAVRLYRWLERHKEDWRQ